MYAFDEFETGIIQEKINTYIEDDETFKKYKKTKIPRMTSNSVDMAFVFVYAINAVKVNMKSFDNEIQAKLKGYMDSFGFLPVLEYLVDKYGNGKGYNSHLRVHEINGVVRQNKAEIEGFISFILSGVDE